MITSEEVDRIDANIQSTHPDQQNGEKAVVLCWPNHCLLRQPTWLQRPELHVVTDNCKEQNCDSVYQVCTTLQGRYAGPGACCHRNATQELQTKFTQESDSSTGQCPVFACAFYYQGLQHAAVGFCVSKSH